MRFIICLICMGVAPRGFAEGGLSEPPSQGTLTEDRAAALALIDDLLKEPSPAKTKQKTPPPPEPPPSAVKSPR